MLAFADFSELFLLETDASKLGLGAVLSQKQTDGQYHLVAYVSLSLTVHEGNYHSTKQEFLALKWVITEQFQEYLLQKPFCCQDQQQPAHLYHDYIQFRCYLTPLGRITHMIHLSYQIPKGMGQCSHRCPELSYIKAGCGTVKSILDGVTMGLTGRVDAHDPVVAETDEEIYKQSLGSCHPS